VASVAEGRRRPGDGPAWAEVGHVGRATAGPAQKNKKMSWAVKAIGPNWQWATKKLFSQFSNKNLSFKIKDSNAFKPNLN
jgi:hypothetical protein